MLLIDCGNTRVKAQYRPDGRVQASFAIAYRDGWSRALGAWIGNLPAERCLFASVLDAHRQQQLDACLAERFDESVTRCLAERERCGVINGYREPGRLGVDRWLALIGAASPGHGDRIVIDAGSAMTLDLLRADGHHLGGAILPGFSTGEESFRRIFSHLDYDDPRIGASDDPGDSTEAAIQLNFSHDPMKRLQFLVTHWLERLQPDSDILLTGGDAVRVQRELGRTARIVPDLVFDGIARYAGE